MKKKKLKKKLKRINRYLRTLDQQIWNLHLNNKTYGKEFYRINEEIGRLKEETINLDTKVAKCDISQLKQKVDILMERSSIKYDKMSKYENMEDDRNDRPNLC